jgi:hypothetical protein
MVCGEPYCLLIYSTVIILAFLTNFESLGEQQDENGEDRIDQDEDPFYEPTSSPARVELFDQHEIDQQHASAAEPFDQ